MINAHELRIGNWVMGEPFSIPKMGIESNGWTKLTAYGILCISEGGLTVHPIPLSPDLLERCGFVKDGFNAYVKSIDPFKGWDDYNGFKELHFAGDYLYIQEDGKGNRPGDIVTIWNKDLMKEFYLHQLQNLFYALTGTELKITL